MQYRICYCSPVAACFERYLTTLFLRKGEGGTKGERNVDMDKWKALTMNMGEAGKDMKLRKFM
jgi:hypothetical protein